MSILKEVKMVLWASIGLGDRNRAHPPTGRPLVLVAIAFALLGLFLATLAILAKLAASWS
jgi:hypothetical protein